jgi:hypothetical protein
VTAINELGYYLTTSGLLRTTGSVDGTDHLWPDVTVAVKSLKDQVFFVPNSQNFGKELFVMPFTKMSQVIQFGDLTSVKEGGADFVFPVSSSSTLPLILSSTSDKIQITNNTVKILKPGTVTIKATQGGNTGVNASEESKTFCINPAKPTVTLKQDNVTSQVLQSSATVGNQWYENGNLIAGATSTTFEAHEGGNYAVASTVEGCQGETSNVLAVDLGGGTISGLEDEAGLNVFPNPAKDKLSVEWQGNFVGVSLIDTKGVAKLNTSFVDHTELSIAELPVGLYILRLTSADRQIIKKFIKE